MNKVFKVDCWLKNNKDWYYPQKEVDLSQYDNVELLSLGHDGDLFYAYNNGQKENGRLFKGRYSERLLTPDGRPVYSATAPYQPGDKILG